jgi:hypothetical protein
MHINESISLGWNGDISTITSPAFEQECRLSPIVSGSLFARLARTRQQLLVEESVHKHPGQESTLLIGSPTESATRSTDDYLSPIKASDSLFECDPVAKLEDDDCHHFFADRSTSPEQTRSRVCVQEELHRNRRELVDQREPRIAAFDASTNRTTNTLIGILNDSTTSYQTSSSCKKDEWREVVDPESGRTYYYNRMTRVSKWKLPKGAVLAKPKEFRDKIRISINESHDASQLTDRSSTTDRVIVKNESGNQTASRRKALANARRLIDELWSSSNTSIRQDVSPPDDNQASREDGTSTSESPEPSLSQGTSYVEHAINHLKSPQDCDTTSCSLFCMYCGRNCHSVEMLGLHLTQCGMSKQVDGSTQNELKQVVLEFFSNRTSKSSYQTPGAHHLDVIDSNQRQGARLTRRSLQKMNAFDSPAVSRSSGSAYSEWNETKLIGDIRAFTIERSKSAPTKQYQRKNVSDYCTKVKKCPFCEDKFSEGNQFSGHLLRCPERRRLRSRRGASKKESPVITCPRALAEIKSNTPGRRLPWE